ncbi:heme-binding protein [Streptomyces sp. NRRL B-24572]|uniref:GlcG/HbpS family heme-binding protein n=1 Tax=Streptomyces sp. NRRL B-24572 TaxID=1962156 RepID=UPI000A38F5F1|nr:heme-binding protein [Streptomyces sp. NRRL B-24572]
MSETALTLQDAVRRAEAGIAAASGLDLAVNLAVVDAGGHLLHFARMDGALLGSIDLALRKARTAALFRAPSSVLGGLSAPGGPCYGIEWTNDGLVSIGGGLPITDPAGRFLGAVGVSGGTAEQDVLIARACTAN